MNVNAIDILGIGCAAVDELLYVGGYPRNDSKVTVRRRERRCGGLTAMALMAAARLGARCAFAGALGDDELSGYVLDAMRAQGVNVSTTVRRPDANPAYAVIVVDESTAARTIVSDGHGVVGADELRPPASIIRAAQVLFIDHYGVPGQIRAAAIARAAGIPVVADLEDARHPRFAELLALVDHLILSRDFAQRLTGTADPATAARELWRDDRAVVVVTAGADGCYSFSGDAPPLHQPAFTVKAMDTTGCGDVFHGAYAAALAEGCDVDERLRRAAAAAALKASGGAQLPDRAAIECFLAAHQICESV